MIDWLPRLTWEKNLWWCGGMCPRAYTGPIQWYGQCPSTYHSISPHRIPIRQLDILIFLRKTYIIYHTLYIFLEKSEVKRIVYTSIIHILQVMKIIKWGYNAQFYLIYICGPEFNYPNWWKSQEFKSPENQKVLLPGPWFWSKIPMRN